MSYRCKCRNPKCGKEFLRYYPTEEFDRLQYGGSEPGISCFDCGYKRMEITKSKNLADDGFKPGFQRNIRKYCNTYGEYKAHLKAMGLVEYGYEDLKQVEESPEYFTDDYVKELREKFNVDLTEGEVKEIRASDGSDVVD